MARGVHFARGDQEFAADGVVHFHGFASTGEKQLSGRELYGFRKFETAFVQWRRGGKGLLRGVINFGAVKRAAPVTIVRTTRDKYATVGEQSCRVLVAGGKQATGESEFLCGGVKNFSGGGDGVGASAGDQYAAITQYGSGLLDAG